jgi:hypothetical protein
MADADYGWSDDEWNDLVTSIALAQCTPFIGSGACYGVLPTGRELAAEWAGDEYPFPDRENLVKVAQYLAVDIGSLNTKNRLVKRFKDKGPPDFTQEGEPHMTLAALRLPVYLTTNYDDFMYKALQAAVPAGPEGASYKPQRDHCRWYDKGSQKSKAKAKLPHPPSPYSPVIYHLHGILDVPRSMVLTEDDYLDFLVATSELENLIPSEVRTALSNTSLLFIGYSLEDLDFKVILRRLSTWMQRAEGANHVAVQIKPTAVGQPPTPEELARVERQQTYLAKHYGLQSVKVYWGTAVDFCRELRKAWMNAKVAQ